MRYPFASSHLVDVGPSVMLVAATGVDLVTAGPLAVDVSLGGSFATHDDGSVTTGAFALNFTWY